ncbi:MAG: glutamate--tRNA ligase family protein [bacterium]
MSVRVRFAPSPTGQVHIGNIRAAIFNWLFARHNGGQFLLRIEDTDRERSTPEAVQTILRAMEWLGITFDETPLYQSTQHDQHRQAAEKLLASGHAYKEDKGGTGQGDCILFRMPGTDIGFHDEIKGDLNKKAEDMKDFVIVRSNGTPVFHLANVVDDITQGITHIIRGDDHVENTFRHVALYKALGAPVPRYAHLPMIVNAQGKPYSKRDGAAYVGQFRDMGYSADALFNYLTLLGWSPGEDREKMTREEIIAAFTLDRVKSGPAQMDIRKLTHMNGLYLAELPVAVFAEEVRRYLAKLDWGQNLEESLFMSVCQLMQSRTPLYPQCETWKYFFVDPIEYDEKAVQKTLAKEGIKPALEALRHHLAECDFSEPGIQQAIRKAEAALGSGEGKLNQPLRVAVTGVAIGAGIYEILAIMGRTRSLARLETSINRL